jgi:hypothetical protein
MNDLNRMLFLSAFIRVHPWFNIHGRKIRQIEGKVVHSRF